MTRLAKEISVTEFRVRCLKLIYVVEHKHVQLVITKRGRPVAKLVPYDEKPRSVFGFMAGTATIEGDIIRPIDVRWNAEHE